MGSSANAAVIKGQLHVMLKVAWENDPEMAPVNREAVLVCTGAESAHESPPTLVPTRSPSWLCAFSYADLGAKIWPE